MEDFETEKINMETVRFIGMLNELAEISKEGDFSPFYGKSESTHGVWYDDKKEDEYGYPIVLDACTAPEHHDIVSTYDDYCRNSGFIVRAEKDEDGCFSITVLNPSNDECMITVEGGKWRFI